VPGRGRIAAGPGPDGLATIRVPSAPATGNRRWRGVLLAAIALGGLGLLALAGRSTLTRSFSTLGHIRWAWIPLAVFCEFGSMAAFARSQRRLLRAGGTKLHLRSVMAVTYAGNAISVSLPLAGPEVSAAFSFRQFSRHGIDPVVAGWALAVSGIISSFAFSFVLAAGAIGSHNPAAVGLGLGGAVISLVPTVAVVAALRFEAARRRLNRLLARLVALSRRLFRRPGPGAEQTLERLLDRLSAIRLPRLQYAEVFGLSVGNWLADCLCLLAALDATGSAPHLPDLVLAYGLAMAAGGIGLTPGGLGVMEVALTAALVGAGVTGQHALAGVLVYRLISFWLVMAAGWAVMVLLLRRQRADAAVPEPAVVVPAAYGAAEE